MTTGPTAFPAIERILRRLEVRLCFPLLAVLSGFSVLLIALVSALEAAPRGLPAIAAFFLNFGAYLYTAALVPLWIRFAGDRKSKAGVKPGTHRTILSSRAQANE